MYRPLEKLRSVQASVMNAIDIETAMKFIHIYHDSGEDGRMLFDTEKGPVVVYSDEDAIYVSWDDTA